MKIRIFSDLHWEHTFKAQHQTRFIDDPYPEFWQPSRLDTDSETTLILAGDLWNDYSSLDVIHKFNRRFKYVIVVLGNHDYYKHNVLTFNQDYELEIARRGLDNVILLDSTTRELDGVLFVGATLWTNMRNEDPLTVISAEKFMVPDFSLINCGKTYTDDYVDRKIKFNPDSWLKLNRQQFDYIKTIVELNRDKPVVVVTHHGCTWESIHEKFKDQYIGNGYFVSEYSDFILNNENVKVWAHGHIHNKMNYHVGNCNVITNPYGYPRENSDFDEISLYEVS